MWISPLEKGMCLAQNKEPVRVRFFTVIFHFVKTNHGVRLLQETGKAPVTLPGR